MSLPLLLTLWPSSVLFTAVVSYRLGVSRHATVTIGRHRADMVSRQDPWATGPPDNSGRAEIQTAGLPPGTNRAVRRHCDDTEVLPRVTETGYGLSRRRVRRA